MIAEPDWQHLNTRRGLRKLCEKGAAIEADYAFKNFAPPPSARSAGLCGGTILVPRLTATGWDMPRAHARNGVPRMFQPGSPIPDGRSRPTRNLEGKHSRIVALRGARAGLHENWEARFTTRARTSTLSSIRTESTRLPLPSQRKARRRAEFRRAPECPATKWRQR